MISPLQRRIGVLTGGADSPGINAAIRSFVLRLSATAPGIDVLGILNGWSGILSSDVRLIDQHTVRDILPLGGTILGTSRITVSSQDPSAVERLNAAIDQLNLQGLLAIGDRETLALAASLTQRGVPIVGIPETMDNDIPGTDYCLGFNSAVCTVVDALDKLHTTASAHRRVMVVEVMGCSSGAVAVSSGVAGGAHCILVPERLFSIDSVAAFVRQRRGTAQDFSIVVVSEGVRLSPHSDDLSEDSSDGGPHLKIAHRHPTPGQVIGESIEQLTGVETRVTVLGHVQRGGSPSVYDRLMGTRFGAMACTLVLNNQWGQMVCLQQDTVTATHLDNALGPARPADLSLVDVAGIFTGLPDDQPLSSVDRATPTISDSWLSARLNTAI